MPRASRRAPRDGRGPAWAGKAGGGPSRPWSEIQLQVAGPMPVGIISARIHGVDGSCRAEYPSLVHREMVGGGIAFLVAKDQRVGGDRVGSLRTDTFLPGLPGLLNAAADIVDGIAPDATKQ